LTAFALRSPFPLRSTWASHGSRALAAALATLTLTACGVFDDDDEAAPPPPVAQAQLRAIHASADTPAVDVFINGARALAGVSFGQASGFNAVPAGSTRVQVTLANQPATTAPIDAALPLAAGRDYTAIAIGSGASGATRLQAVLIDDAGTAPAAGQVKLRVVHGAPAVGAVDIFVTAPGDALPATPTIPALAFGQQAPTATQAALSVPAGSYRVRARVAGQTAIAFDSGAVPLAAGTDAVVVAVPDAGPGPSLSPIQLLLAPKGGTTAFVRDGRAALRVGHFSPNVPAVDVFLKAPGAANAAGNRALSNVSFPADSGFLAVDAGSYDASVALAGSLAGVLDLNGAALARGSSTSVFAIGLLNGSGAQALRLAAFADDRTPVAGQAKVRVIHLSPDAPAVDVVVLNGAAIASRAVTNLAFPNATASALTLPPGTYNLGVTATGQSTVVASQSFPLAAGDVVMIAAVGCLSTTGACAGGQAFQFKVLNDR
jgi:hypothetical protein